MAKQTTFQFEEQLIKLENIVEMLDNSDVPLEELLKNFEEGMKISRELRDYLEKAEQKVIDITKQSEYQQ